LSWWFTSFEKFTRTEYVGYSGEAIYNRYFAAQSLLETLDIEADSVASLQPATWLPEPADTIVIALDKAVNTQSETLDSWVFSGGHLVIVPGDNPDDLMDYQYGALGARFVSFVPSPPDDDGDEAAEEDEGVDYRVNLAATAHRIALDDGTAATATLSDKAGLIAARMPRGEGVVTIVAGAHYFTNSSLGESDHARLLLDVVAGFYDPGKVWFVYSNRFDPLWLFIWKSIPLTLIAAAAAYLLWLLSIFPRFGPPVVQAAAERRSLMEHITAAGLFEWRHSDKEALAESTITALIHDAEIRHPGIERLTLEQQARRLAKISGLPVQDIADALATADGLKPRVFTKHMQTLQETRDRL
jgi:hypothetical protein